jgi:hypothetical protein
MQPSGTINHITIIRARSWLTAESRLNPLLEHAHFTCYSKRYACHPRMIRRRGGIAGQQPTHAKLAKRSPHNWVGFLTSRTTCTGRLLRRIDAIDHIDALVKDSPCVYRLCIVAYCPAWADGLTPWRHRRTTRCAKTCGTGHRRTATSS